MSPESTPPIFIIDTVRHRSHLFFRYLSTHPSLHPVQHPFLPAIFFGRESNFLQDLNPSEARKKEIEESYKPLMGDDTPASCAASLQKETGTAAEECKALLGKEHWFWTLKLEHVLGLLRGSVEKPEDLNLSSNPTYLPDEIFETLKPVILIRHPCYFINSVYRDALQMTQQRPGDDEFDMMCMSRPLRVIYDYFQGQGRTPVVVDAEDMLWRTEAMSKNLCAALGLDPAGLKDSWDPVSSDDVAKMNPVVAMLTRNALESTGIQRPEVKPEEPSVEKTAAMWGDLYGEEVAAYLRKLVEESMPHYEYLRQLKA